MVSDEMDKLHGFLKWVRGGPMVYGMKMGSAGYADKNKPFKFENRQMSFLELSNTHFPCTISDFHVCVWGHTNSLKVCRRSGWLFSSTGAGPLVLNSEPLSFRCRASYVATAARGIGGTNCNLLFWNKASKQH
jgi:hypothetical protein